MNVGDEKIHIDFWQRICAFPAKSSTLPSVFDDRELVCDELNRKIPNPDIVSKSKKKIETAN